MAFCFFGINNSIFFVSVIYLIPFGHPKLEPDYDPRKEFTLKIHHDCYDNIHGVFGYRESKKEYFQFATIYLRYVTHEEKLAYNRNLGPREHPVIQFLLYEGTIYNEEFAYAYYVYLSKRFELLKEDYFPDEYCRRFPGEEFSCLNALKYFGFVLGDMDKIIKFAYLNTVLYDIKHFKYVPRPNIFPPTPSYAIQYLQALPEAATQKRGNKK